MKNALATHYDEGDDYGDDYSDEYDDDYNNDNPNIHDYPDGPNEDQGNHDYPAIMPNDVIPRDNPDYDPDRQTIRHSIIF